VINERTRREEVLETAAALFASSGLRTSLNEIANACGILPGSLYHHFDSKEAIIVELVQRYRDDLDRVAKEARDALHARERRPVEALVVELGEAIAECAVRHRAALLLTLYEPPSGAGDELTQLARLMPTAIDGAMLEILRSGKAAGEIRSGIDLTLLAERICQSMLHVGVGVYHRSRAGRELPAQKCRVLLHGVAVKASSNSALDRSKALRAARDAVASWADEVEDDRIAHLRSVARAEFGRRGYEATTMRDIAGAAALSTGAVYRLFASKDELLQSIMQSYSEHVAAAWDAVISSPSTSVERLDALLWVNVNVLARFAEEFKIQLAWLRQSPPTSANIGLTFGRQIKDLTSLLDAGIRSGELRIEGASPKARAMMLYELLQMPEGIIPAAGMAGAHGLARETVLRGAATRA
jgi:AcrR family transcriptional regulator